MRIPNIKRLFTARSAGAIALFAVIVVLTFIQIRRARLDPMLIDAVEHGRLGAVARLLDEGANPNCRSPVHDKAWARLKRMLDWSDHEPGEPVLLKAIKRGDIDAESLLLARGADPNGADGSMILEVTALMRASGARSPPAIRTSSDFSEPAA